MEYVHMKDMRAAAFEPMDVLSGYRYQGGLGYYESIRDASVNFYFDYLRKGTYVFEYKLNVTQKGEFSNGITSIQCLYAPEFAAHSQGSAGDGGIGQLDSWTVGQLDSRTVGRLDEVILATACGLNFEVLPEGKKHE